MKRIGRRSFLKLTGGAAVAGMLGLGLDSFLIEPRWVHITRTTIRLPRLPAAWQSVRIAHLTDLHCQRKTGLGPVRRTVAMANAERPDLVVFTGDLIDRADYPLDPLAEALAAISAPLGKFAALGNHDHWANRAGVVRCLENAGFTWLINSHRVLWRQDQPLVLAGVDDPWAGRPDLQAALGGLQGQAVTAPRILLCHNPDYAEDLPAWPHVDLMLSGHSHGGQVKIPWGPRPLLPIQRARYAAGLAPGPRCLVYTSVGLGTVGPSVRFNCRPEIAMLTLVG